MKFTTFSPISTLQTLDRSQNPQFEHSATFYKAPA
jgi:hypothetical protein